RHFHVTGVQTCALAISGAVRCSCLSSPVGVLAVRVGGGPGSWGAAGGAGRAAGGEAPADHRVGGGLALVGLGRVLGDVLGAGESSAGRRAGTGGGVWMT